MLVYLTLGGVRSDPGPPLHQGTIVPRAGSFGHWGWDHVSVGEGIRAVRHRAGAARRRIRSDREWKRAGFSVPAPSHVKRAVLARYNIPGSSWVETGTWLGDTTEFLSGFASHVWTIEPGPALASTAKERFRAVGNVTVIEGLSEEHLDAVVTQLQGSVCFWLDGHFSAGDTFQGPSDTPIMDELAVIAGHLKRLQSVVVLVDDVRCFDPSDPRYATYPTRTALVSWADDNQLDWTVEHDIFVARSRD